MSEPQLKISKEQFEQMIKLYNPCMDDYLYVYDLKDDYYRISGHAVERFCLPGESFSNATEMHRLFVDEHDIEMLLQEMDDIKKGKKQFHDASYRWLDKKKEPVWINCRGQVIADEDGTPHFLIGCINEIGRRQIISVDFWEQAVCMSL